MRSNRPRVLDVLSISALDLFASALGVFMLVALVLFPFYLRQPALDAALAAARTESAAAEAALTLAQQQLIDAETRSAEARARREQAVADLAAAEADKQAAEEAARVAVAAAARERLPDPTPLPPTPAPRAGTLTIGDLDVVFVMDATGSMRDEIADVQRTLLSIVRVLERLAPSLHVGFVAFKDRTDEYIVQGYPLSPMTGPHRAQIETFVRTLRAKGGGDTPEPVGRALGVATGMAWRPSALGRIVIISDAPAHPGEWQPSFDLAANWRRAGSGGGRDRRVSAIYTGRAGDGRLYYEQLVTAGGGEVITHRGQIMESVLLSVLDGARLRREGGG